MKTMLQVNGKPVRFIEGDLKPKPTWDETLALHRDALENRPLGLSWDKIAEMQKSGKLRSTPAKIKCKGRPCVRCGKPSGSVGLLPQCKRCLKIH
jgi:hypothetical protein